MSKRNPPEATKPVWAYSYEIKPAQPRDRLLTIKALLDAERASARVGSRTWEGRLVAEKQVTHILIVSDSPEQDLEANRRMEAALRELEAEFSVSAVMAVGDSDAEGPVVATLRPARPVADRSEPTL